MAKLSQIRRLAILINKLSAVRYVPTDALIAHVENTLTLYDNKDSNYSQRTMQRDFGLIDEMFGIVIRNDKSRGYYIAELDEMTDNYKELLLNFELLSSINTDSTAIPRTAGVYMVVYTEENMPEFLSRGTGGFFKGKDPNVSITELETNWVENTCVVYIGKAGTTLRKRLNQYLKFGNGQNIGHWGGRYIWQIKNSGNLLLCWKPTPDEDPETVETALIARFKEQHGGHRPFANLKD